MAKKVEDGPPEGWSPRDDGWVQIDQVAKAPADVDRILRAVLPDLVEPLLESGAPTLVDGIRALYAAHRAGVAAYARLSDELRKASS